ncbi:MAG: competence/damage-inducible protein A [Armatimonadetes bacterium]|nr:competence/damage-inducible protein A [Armatimonadota bacterium]
MRAELISVGTELLLGQITDTNAVYLARLLASYGVDVLHKQTVGDNLDRVRGAVVLALQRADLVIMTGGLGPTEDDLTVEAVALAIDRPLVYDQSVADGLAAFFERRRRTPPASVFRQARIPAGTQVIPNRRGTAPGLIVPVGDQTIFIFPGVPHEMEGLVAEGLIPWLQARTGGDVIRSRVLRIAGLGESVVEERVRELIHGANPTVAPLAKTGEVHLRITAKGPPGAVGAMLDEMEAALRARLGDAVFGIDDEALHTATARLLIDQRKTLAIAESCTAGLVASRLTEVPGSSAFLLAGFIPYSNEAKVRDLGVPAALLAAHGAVSAEVVAAMAAGARRVAGADVGLAITGIAGPSGGTPAKPVGLVFVAIDSDARTRTEELHFGEGPGRSVIRHLAAQTAINLLRLTLLRW